LNKKGELFGEPQRLGLHRSFEMVAAPVNKTFFYRNEHKRVIEPGWTDPHRLHNIPGPLIYAVTDLDGLVRYIGKWVSETPLYARWFRHEHIHHQTSSRKRFIAELDAGRGPLTVWSASAQELRRFPLPSDTTRLSAKQFIENLEALWINRWRGQLWNKACPAGAAAFSDGEYWRLLEP